MIAKMSDDKKMAVFDRELILLKKLSTLPRLSFSPHLESEKRVWLWFLSL